MHAGCTGSSGARSLSQSARAASGRVASLVASLGAAQVGYDDQPPETSHPVAAARPAPRRRPGVSSRHRDPAVGGRRAHGRCLAYVHWGASSGEVLVRVDLGESARSGRTKL